LGVAGVGNLILAVGVSDRDGAWLDRIEGAGRFRFRDLGDFAAADDPELCRPRDFLRKAVAEARRSAAGARGVIACDDYPASLLSLAIANRLGLPGASLQSAMACAHKAWSRTLQRAVVPLSAPRFQVIDPGRDYRLRDLRLAFPFWLKPVKSAMSFLGRRIDGYAEFEAAVAMARRELPAYARAFNELLGLVPPPVTGPLAAVRGDWLIAEALLEGRQCTLDGLVDNGRFEVIGIVDSIKTADGMSFGRFAYPTRLSRRDREAMAAVAARVLEHVGYRHGLFNIEFFVDGRGGPPMIVEINPRLSPQFTDIYRKVDGRLLHQYLVELAAGLPVTVARGRGRYRAAASFVLRSSADRLVRRLPSKRELREIRRLLPDTRIELRPEPGDRLSDLMQDGYSYCYGWINIGGANRADLKRRLACALNGLTIDLAPVEPAPAGEVESMAGSRRNGAGANGTRGKNGAQGTASVNMPSVATELRVPVKPRTSTWMRQPAPSREIP
jgi:hypothetical protein